MVWPQEATPQVGATTVLLMMMVIIIIVVVTLQIETILRLPWRLFLSAKLDNVLSDSA